MTPLFSLRFSLLLAAVLGIPFAVRTVTNLQPFPALLFPASAYQVPIVDGRASFPLYAAYARTKAGLRPLDIAELLAPMPDHYFSGLAQRAFALDGSTTQELVLKRLKTFAVPRHVATAGERKEILAWLSTRVRGQFPDADALVLRTQTGQYDVASGKLSGASIDGETVVLLP